MVPHEEIIVGDNSKAPYNITLWWLMLPCIFFASCTGWAPTHACCPQAVPFFQAVIFKICNRFLVGLSASCVFQHSEGYHLLKKEL